MCPVKLRTKLFRIFHILNINRIMPFCNLFMERPSYIAKPGPTCAISVTDNDVFIELVMNKANWSYTFAALSAFDFTGHAAN